MSTIKNGTLTKTREITTSGYDTRSRYSQASQDYGKRAKLPSDILVFVMAVEIERLVRENTQLKQELQQLSDSNLDRVQYERQIRDLMEKLKSQNNSHSTLLVDIEQLQTKVYDLEEQLRKQSLSQRDYDPNWKAKLSQMELQLSTFQKQITSQSQQSQSLESMNRELEDYRRQLGGRSASDLMWELEDMRRKLQQQQNQNETNQLRNEVNRLNNELQKVWGDNETLVKEIDSLQFRLSTQNDDELRRLRMELSRLQELNNSLQLTISQQESSLVRLQQQNQSLTLQLESNMNNSNEVNRQKYVLDEYKEKIRVLESRFQEISLQNERLRQQDHKVAVLMAEVERLNALLRQTNSEVDEWKSKYQRMELALLDYRQIEKTNRDAASKNEVLLDEIDRLKKILEQKQYDMDEITKQYDVLSSQVGTYKYNLQSSVGKQQEYESRAKEASYVQQENDRLKKQIQQLQLQSQQYQQQVSTLQVQMTEQTRQVQSLSQQTRYANQSGDVDKLKRQISEYENKIAMLSLEISRLKNCNNNPNTNYSHAAKLTDLLTVIALMSAELDSLRGISYEKSIVQSQKFSDNASQSQHTQSVVGNYSYRG